ncbi:MAG: transcription-repair coupling factor [Thermodesulfobacteriota bacterium]|nr:transcription-repair coupling factor [Thermodesulfobacteriota bacterium]
MTENQEKKSVQPVAQSVQSLIETVKSSRSPVECAGVTAAADAYVTARLAGQEDGVVVVLASSIREAERLGRDLEFFTDDTGLAAELFPTYNVLPFKPLAYHNQTAADRIGLLFRMAQGKSPQILIVTLEGLLQKLPPVKAICDYADILMVNEDIEPEALTRKMVDGGYTRTSIVEEPGDFSVRGNIVDIFSPACDMPVRIELFGDTVDTMRFFSPATQRRGRDVEELILLPARETILDDERRGRFIAGVKKQAAIQDLPVSESRRIIEQISAGEGFAGMESYMPLVYDELATLFDYLPRDARFVVLSPAELNPAASHLEDQVRENFDTAREHDRLCVPLESLYLSWETGASRVEKYPGLKLNPFPLSSVLPYAEPHAPLFHLDIKNNSGLQTRMKAQKDRDHLLAPLVEWINENREAGRQSIIACSGENRLERSQYLLQPYGIAASRSPSFSGIPGAGSGTWLVPSSPSAGFVFPEESLAIACDTEVFGRPRKRRRSGDKTAQAEFLDIENLKRGDLVVHVDHGIGRYEGIEKVKVEGVTNDFLLITYREGDRLYLSVDRMDMAKKYIGVDGAEPVLDKMGGSAWARVKAKAKKEVEKIAKELLDLYARRKVSQGKAFNPPDREMQDFEAGFPYEETGDQLKVIDEVLMDMASSQPMDRLVCGDVGYGKTEIAMRAAFAAACDGMQVAVLVPTTVLAEQHYQTFCDRFADYPVTIACLNRFRSTAKQKTIVADARAGKTDIVIGTHRLLSKDVGFKQLGLIILDEEQRFGVRHKERLKAMRTTVDVLSLTATPIPRTLHMSLMGIRDISVITTPPENRRSIKTYIAEFDEAVIAAGIRKELARGGQIYFVHNNIHKIWYIANRLQQIVPEVRLGVAHGRLAKDELESEMMKFVNKEIDMLVCTRIIESGLDIPSANTIFVNRADKFGLAQIYQLRGRVGRADEQAYAYLFIPRDTVLTKDAQKRLKVLMEHSDLGSGFQIAMNDLSIRGGGSALGVSQSGHIAAVGYDMFLQLMENTIAELKGETVETPLEPEINIPMSAFIPESYIPDIDQRMAIYRRLSRATTLAGIGDMKSELTDRFGKPAAETENLLLKIMLKVLSRQAGIRKLDLNEDIIHIQFSNDHLPRPEGVFAFVAENPETCEITPQEILKVRLSGCKGRNAIGAAKNILKEIVRHVTC